MSKLCKGPPINASSTVWFYLAKWFQRRRFLKIRPIRIKNCQWQPYLFSNPNKMNKFYKGSPIDVSCIVWFYLAKWFQRRWFWKFSQSELRTAHCGHICCPNGTKWTNLTRGSGEPVSLTWFIVHPCAAILHIHLYKSDFLYLTVDTCKLWLHYHDCHYWFSRLGWQAGSSDKILTGDHLRTIPLKFGPNKPSSFREEDF